jgi:PAS domain S-box-containing protein
MSADRDEAAPTGPIDLELADLLDLVPFDLMLIDEDHRIVIPAEAFEERLAQGTTIVGRPCYQVVHNEPASFPGCPLLLAVERNRPVQLEVTEKGSGRSLISCVYPTRHRSPDGKRLFLHSLMDITGLRQAEKDLRDSEERYRVLLDNTSDFILALDAEGRVTAANRSFADAMNVMPAHALGTRPSDWPGRAAEFEVVWSALHQRAMKLGLPFEDEICIPFPNKATHFFDAVATPIIADDQQVTGVTIRLRDITQRKKAEEALRERDEQLR